MNHRLAATALVALLVLPLVGCDSRPENCLVEDEGFFLFTAIPEPGSYPFGFSGTLLSIEDQFTEPPTVRYTFRLDNGGAVNVNINDLGWTMPLVVGGMYSVELEIVVDEFLENYSLLIEDDQGVAVIVESDWNAANNRSDGRFDYVRKGNDYGSLPLTVTFNDSGCEARVANSAEYLSIHNWRLRFDLDGEARELGNKESAVLGAYSVHVWRAQSQLAKQTGDPQNANIQPQISFFVQRTDLGS